MELTKSYIDHLPAAVLDRYEICETRNAAAILKTTSLPEFDEVVEILSNFVLLPADLLDAGGNESKIAARLNGDFRSRGWREARVDTYVRSEMIVTPYRPANEKEKKVKKAESFNEGYKVDNVKERIALDVEWNAKDGNLDRDISAYRSFYDVGIIDGAVLITRTLKDLRVAAQELAKEAGMNQEAARKRLGTTTTTNYDKLLPRLTRGDAGGCPLLGVAISARCLAR